MGDPLSACESSHCDSRTSIAAQAHPASLTHDAATATAHTQSVMSMICPCAHRNTIRELSDHRDAKIVARIVLQIAQVKFGVRYFLKGCAPRPARRFWAPPPGIARMATGRAANRAHGDRGHPPGWLPGRCRKPADESKCRGGYREPGLRWLQERTRGRQGALNRRSPSPVPFRLAHLPHVFPGQKQLLG
jgi:hypothetical protein